MDSSVWTTLKAALAFQSSLALQFLKWARPRLPVQEWVVPFYRRLQHGRIRAKTKDDGRRVSMCQRGLSEQKTPSEVIARGLLMSEVDVLRYV